ncbi:MAG: hypothetical protein ACMXYG_04795 [Candidatus Woesearchaeota archaeon]
MDLDKIKKLSPEERLKKLDEIIETKNKELEKANKDIEEAKKLAEKAKKDNADLVWLEKIKVPQIEEVDVQKLFHQEEELEQKVKDVKVEEETSSANNLYKMSADAPTGQLYSNLKNLYQQVKENGSVTSDVAGQLEILQYAIQKKQEDIQAGNYNPNTEIIDQANSIKTIADKILTIYTGGVKRANGI